MNPVDYGAQSYRIVSTLNGKAGSEASQWGHTVGATYKDLGDIPWQSTEGALWSRKREVKKGFLEVFYLGVSSAGREKCNQKQREVTPHHSSHPGRAKEEPKGRKGDPPSMLESKKQAVQERDVSKRYIWSFFLQDNICDVLVPFFRKSLKIKRTLRLCLLTSISGLRMHTEELL